MKKATMIMAAVVITFLFGCNIRRSFQPPRYNYELYWKPGITKTGAMKALLECGMEDPLGDLRLGTGTYTEQLENTARSELCMLNSGFMLTPGDKAMCKDIPNLQACKPENVHLIPTRDINRRLNSPYCKAYPKAHACEP